MQKQIIPSIYLASIAGAEEILKKIEMSSLKGKIFLKNDEFLGEEKYRSQLMDRMEFFIEEKYMEEATRTLESLFLPYTKENKDGTGEDAENVPISLYKTENQGIAGTGKPVCLSLSIDRKPYHIPIRLFLVPYPGHDVYPRTKTGTGVLTGESFSYDTFPPEEYLALGFYEILDGLELLQNLSWYKEIYELLLRESVEGRRIWESFHRLLEERPIPSLEKRLDTIKEYKDYGYMKKRWKSQSRREREHYPQWEQVVTLLVAFFTPVFEGIIRDEVFLGDWMPQLGRYLD